MEEDPRHPLNTREFVALWNVAKEEHLVQRLGGVLGRLARGGVLPAMNERQVTVLAQALHLAGDPSAGLPVAVQFLETQVHVEGESPPGG